MSMEIGDKEVNDINGGNTASKSSGGTFLGLNFREILLSGRKFTWANSMPSPTYKKLDRVLDDIPKVSMEENNFLTKEFTEEEVKHVVFQMEHKKAPGLDGFPAELIEHKGK
uniref:Retrotransposon protein, putative, unclassified n=1 Tax=Oryza sativa subsp. japonica TaxID=39947 RepID=Q339E7_ORYSJ|nr:hypothetical protein LOC_Os10g21740 [Oryza sativa Japonica Group]